MKDRAPAPERGSARASEPRHKIAAARDEASRRGGTPLPDATRDAWRGTLGDLSAVRLHSGSASAAAAEALDARAFTDGAAIHLGPGAPAVGTAAGARLLAHELAHAIQAPPIDPLRLVAPREAPAERDADAITRGARPTGVRRDAAIHRFPKGEGLKDDESLPPPLVMQVLGDRFLVSVEVDSKRQLIWVVRAIGGSPATGEKVVDNTLRLPCMSADKTVAATIAEVRVDSVSIDLYGDQATLVTLRDRPEPGMVDSRDHAFEVEKNGAPAMWTGNRVDGKMRIELPRLDFGASATPEALRGTAGHSVGTRLVIGGTVFNLTARWYGDRPQIVVNTTAHLTGELVGSNPAVLVPSTAARDRLSLSILKNTGAVVELDLDGDGKVDLRFEHAMADHPAPPQYPGYKVRKHRFIPMTADRVLLDEPNFHDQNYKEDQVLTDIPADQVMTNYDPSMFPAPTPEPAGQPPAQGDFPIEGSNAYLRPGGVYEIRLDADGDRRKELMLRLVPRQCSAIAGFVDYTMVVIQVDARVSVDIPILLDTAQANHLLPQVTRSADGSNDTMVDLVDRGAGAAASRFTIKIAPPIGDETEWSYGFDVNGDYHDVRLPPRASTGAPLVQAQTAEQDVAGTRFLDVKLGEMGDSFRFTMIDSSGTTLLAIASLNEGEPVETRTVVLTPGTTCTPIATADAYPQLLTLEVDGQAVYIADAITAPPYNELAESGVEGTARGNRLQDRNHILTVYGPAVPTTRQIRFDVRGGRFTGADFDQLDVLQPGRFRDRAPAVDAEFEELMGVRFRLGPALRSASDEGVITDETYQSWQDAHLAVDTLRDALDILERKPDAVPDIEKWKQRTAAALQAVCSSMPWVDGVLAFGTLADKVAAGDTSTLVADYVAAARQWETWAHSNISGDWQREATIAVESGWALRGQLSDAADFDKLLGRFDAALGAEVVKARAKGLITDDIYLPWNRLRLAMPKLRTNELLDATSSGSGVAAIDAAAADASALQYAIQVAAQNDYADPTTFTGQWMENTGYDEELTGGYGYALHDALMRRDMYDALDQYQKLMTGVDDWVTAKLPRGSQTSEDEQAFRSNQYVRTMRKKLEDYRGKTDVTPVAGSFVSDDEKLRGVAGYIQVVPLQLITFREGGEWHLHDLTNPEKVQNWSVDDDGNHVPPRNLIAQLNDDDRFPKGVVYFQVPGGEGGTIRCTADKDWWDWARDIGLGLALVGLTLATLGTGTVAVVGAYFLAGAAIVNAVAAGAELYDSVSHGRATGVSITLNILDIIASLAGAGALISGTIVKSAAAAARAGAAWTGATARVAAFADRAYIPLVATGMAGDVTTVAVMHHDMKAQLEDMEKHGATPDEVREARRGFLIQLAITGGLTALSVKGDLPEIRAGKRNIILDVVGDVAVARAAGVRIGGAELDLPKDAHSHAVARWHARDLEAARVALAETPDLPAWHKQWLEQPERVRFLPDGTPEIVMPTRAGALPPQAIQDHLRALAGSDTALVRNERALGIGDKVAELERKTGLRVDPLDPDWLKTRGKLAAELGGGPSAEAMIQRFEQARLGAHGEAGAKTFIAERRQVNAVLHDTQLEEIQALFPGHEVYITGAAATPGSTIPGDIGQIEVVVAVPRDISPDQMAAIELRGQGLQLHPDPAFFHARGIDDVGTTIGIEVKVVPTDALVGLAAAGDALHRIDNITVTRQLQLGSILDVHLASFGVKLEAGDVRIEVLPEKEFKEKFGSGRGRTNFQIEGDQAVIYARVDASPLDMLDEAAHLAQTKDVAWARKMRSNEIDDAAWERASASTRLDMYQYKLDLEIDAKQRSITTLKAQGTAAATDLANVEKQLEQLQQLQAEVAGLTPKQLSQMNAGAIALPDYLKDPPWLFGKRTIVDAAGVRPSRLDVNPKTPRTSTPRLGEGRSSARGEKGVKDVRQVGSSWQEQTIVESTMGGEVVAVPAPGVPGVITVKRASGVLENFTVEAGSTVRVKIGDDVDAGQRLADEVARDYRLVEIDYGGGKVELREEIQYRDPADGWRMRGSDATYGGAIAEIAAKRQIDIALAKRTDLTGTARLEVKRGGGGFDDVIVEFTGTGTGTSALVRVREVKNYPNRTVPVAEFTAITGTDLSGNLTVLRKQVDDALNGKPVGDLAKLSPDQLLALQKAVKGQGIRVEIVQGPTTRIGDPGHHASTVVPELRKRIQAVMGYDALVVPKDGIERIEQTLVDEALGRASKAP